MTAVYPLLLFGLFFVQFVVQGIYARIPLHYPLFEPVHLLTVVFIFKAVYSSLASACFRLSVHQPIQAPFDGFHPAQGGDESQNVRTGHNGLYAGIFTFAFATTAVTVGFFGVDTVYIFQYQPVGTCAGRSTQADFAIGAKTDT